MDQVECWGCLLFTWKWNKGKTKQKPAAALAYSLPSTFLGAAAKSLPQQSPHPEKSLQELCKMLPQCCFIYITLPPNSSLCFSISKGTTGKIPTLAPWERNQSSLKSDSKTAAVLFGMEGTRGVGKMLSQPDWLFWNEFEGMNGNTAGSHSRVSHGSQTTTAPFTSLEQLPMEMRSPKSKHCLPSQSCSPPAWHRWKWVWEQRKKYSRPSAAPSHPGNSPPANKAWDTCCSAGLGDGWKGKSPHLSPSLHRDEWRNMPLPPAPPLFLYDQASSSLTSQEWCLGLGCGNWCSFTETAPFQLPASPTGWMSKALNSAFDSRGLSWFKDTGEPCSATGFLFLQKQ